MIVKLPSERLPTWVALSYFTAEQARERGSPCELGSKLSLM